MAFPVLHNLSNRQVRVLEDTLTNSQALLGSNLFLQLSKQYGFVISFIVPGAHHNLIVKLLNGKFGIQTRGGCFCAGTYGHMLLHVDKVRSYGILNSIRSGNLLYNPGWIRLSIYPIMTNAEINFIMDAIELTVCHFQDWMKEYTYDPASNEYSFMGIEAKEQSRIEDCLLFPTGDRVSV